MHLQVQRPELHLVRQRPVLHRQQTLAHPVSQACHCMEHGTKPREQRRTERMQRFW